MGLSGIYQIHNTQNGHAYIGSATNLFNRKKNHFDKLRAGKHSNKHMQSAFNKYGEKCFLFIPLQAVSEYKDLLLFEQYWIDLARDGSVPLYNKRLVAESNFGMKQTKATIEKRLKTNKERGFTYGKGIPKSKECLERIAASKIGKPHPRKGDVYTLICKKGHMKFKYKNGHYRCKVCRRNQMKFYNALNKNILRGGF